MRKRRCSVVLPAQSGFTTSLKDSATVFLSKVSSKYFIIDININIYIQGASLTSSDTVEEE